MTAASDETPERSVERGALDVVDATAPADRVQRGATTGVRATVRNTGDRALTTVVPVRVGGEPVETREVSLDPGERTTLRIRFEATQSGEVRVGEERAGEITVGTPESVGTPLPLGDTGIGVQVVAVVGGLAVLAAVLAAVPRFRSR